MVINRSETPREVVEIDTLIRALRNHRHWAAVAHVRGGRTDDWGIRLHTTAARLHEQAYAVSLEAACRLFEMDRRSGGPATAGEVAR